MKETKRRRGRNIEPETLIKVLVLLIGIATLVQGYLSGNANYYLGGIGYLLLAASIYKRPVALNLTLRQFVRENRNTPLAQKLLALAGILAIAVYLALELIP